MSRTGTQLFQALSEFLNDWFSSTTTSAGNSAGTTLVDTALQQFGDNRLQGQYVRLTVAGTERRFSGNTQGTGTATLAQAAGAQIAGSIAYTLHKYDPAKKRTALDKARLECAEYLFKLVLDGSVTADGRSRVYPLPSTVVQGPHLAFVEKPLAANQMWNFLQDPLGDDVTNWTASSVTATTVDRDDSDLLVPKYDQTCTKLVVAASTAATYSQTVGNMTNDITAALAADRKMAFCAWVYCTEASKIRLQLIDDASTTSGSYHGGGGWELLSVEKTVAGNNATLLTARLDIASTANAATFYFNRGWLYFGDKERVTEGCYSEEYVVGVRRDDTTQTFLLDSTPPRGHQIRLQGKAPLTALGGDLTVSVEVDERSQEILCAYAAKYLLKNEGLTADDVPEVYQRIANVESRIPELRRAWAHIAPKPHLRSPFAR